MRISNNLKNMDTQDIINDKQDLLLLSLKQFYKQEGNIELILPIVKQKSTKISLRLLDWLVTNYSKKYNVNYNIDNNKNFSIWLDYRNQLKAYSKRAFDPFCRRKRLFYNIKTNDIISIDKDDIDTYSQRDDGFVTTVGQLNFFRWALTYRVVDYADNNINDIESHMLSSADSRKLKPKGKRRKRESYRLSNTVCKQDMRVVIQFP